MPRSCLTLVSLLAALTATTGLAQTAAEPSLLPPPASADKSPQMPQSVDEFSTQRQLPSLDKPPPSQAPAPTSTPAPAPAAGDAVVTDVPLNPDAAAKAPPAASLRDFLGYRYSTISLDWIPGGGDHFGMFSIAWDHYQKAGLDSGPGAGMAFHFLSGPDQTDMPPRVYDFSLAYQTRERLGPLAYDAATAVLAASDFKGSARKGILFPSHAVGFLSVDPAVDLVFGIDYVDRGDIKLLPVAGLIWIPNSDMRFEAVFPRPRAVYQLTDHHRLYLSGELGGGSWAVDRETFGNDLATYRDLRVCLGLEYVDKDGSRSAFEIGYLFDRYLEYTSSLGNMHLDDAVLLRLVTTF